jgi:CheY-like chemotaxis protein
MTQSTKRFILVDDDKLSNYLSKMVLGKLLGDVEVKDFLIPELALKYIETEFTFKPQESNTTLLLDINMPSLTGWEFLDIYKTFTDSIKNHINIYMLSSSINPLDIQLAKLNPLVIDFIEKPLNKVVLLKMFS